MTEIWCQRGLLLTLMEKFKCWGRCGQSLFGNQPDKDYCARLCLSRQKYVSRENKFQVHRTLSKLGNNWHFWKLICPHVLNSTFKMMRNCRLSVVKNKLVQIQDRYYNDEPVRVNYFTRNTYMQTCEQYQLFKSTSWTRKYCAHLISDPSSCVLAFWDCLK